MCKMVFVSQADPEIFTWLLVNKQIRVFLFLFLQSVGIKKNTTKFLVGDTSFYM
jgi:hypothetical protein